MNLPQVVGDISYDVEVTCPHCGLTLCLNQFPYNDEETGYYTAEDQLGLAVFGKYTEPAQWKDLSITYTCCSCHKQFLLSKLEI